MGQAASTGPEADRARASWPASPSRQAPTPPHLYPSPPAAAQRPAGKRAWLDEATPSPATQHTLPEHSLPASLPEATANQTALRLQQQAVRRKAGVLIGSVLQHISDWATMPQRRHSEPFYGAGALGGEASRVAQELGRRDSRRQGLRAAGSDGLLGALLPRRSLAGSLAGRLKGPGVQSNSCATLFVDQTVSRPDLDHTLRCAAVALHSVLQQTMKEGSLPDYDPIFDEQLHPLTGQGLPANYRVLVPAASEMHDFLRAFFTAAVLGAEVAIVGLVYVGRLHGAGVRLQPGNWKRLLLGATMLASKVWDDQAVWNADFCTVLPNVGVASLNQLERIVLGLLRYSVSVSAAEYAAHYFALRTCGVAAACNTGQALPLLTVERAHSLDALSTVAPCSQPIRRSYSSEDFILDPPPAVIP